MASCATNTLIALFPPWRHFTHQGRDGRHDECDEVQGGEQAAAVGARQITEFPHIGDSRLGADYDDEEQ